MPPPGNDWLIGTSLIRSPALVPPAATRLQVTVRANGRTGNRGRVVHAKDRSAAVPAKPSSRS